MRVLMTADAVGGVWTYALELSQALSMRGISVVLATMGPRPSDEQRARAEQIADLALRMSDFRLEWMDDPWMDVERAGQWLLALARDERVDIVHLNGYAHAALDWRKPVLVVAHSCVCSWWEAVHREMPPSPWTRYKVSVHRGLSSADLVIAPTNAHLEQLRALYRFAAPTRVISNARTCSSRRQDSRKEAFILASGRLWDEAKNIRVLDTLARNLSWPIYVAGDSRSPDGKEFVSENLHCLGRLHEDEVCDWLARASIFVHPARYEPFGLSVLEAAHAGCALVLSNLATLREIWTGAAMFVDSENPFHVRSVLEDLMRSDDVVGRLGTLARERAAMLTPARMAQCYEAAYRDLLSRPVKERSVA
jgi:glycogen(starch) synthase